MVMNLPKITYTIILSFFLFTNTSAQIADTSRLDWSADLSHPTINWQATDHSDALRLQPYIVPGFAIAYGFTALASDHLKRINEKFKQELYADHPHNKIHLDNYLMFAPAVSVYALDIAGVKAKHNFRDRTMILLLSNIITNGMVFSVKNMAHQLRPDESDYLSFPSGHTAEAFTSAEFMRQEYKDVSPWYGVAGYAMATATGVLRMYNNKHWFSDVMTGAGIGMASTKFAYWLYPKIQRAVFKGKPAKTLITPTYQNGSFGVGLAHVF